MTPSKFISNQINLRLSRIKEIENVSIAEINDKEKLSKTFNKHATALGYTDKTVFVLLKTGSSISLFSLTTVIGAPVNITYGIVGQVPTFYVRDSQFTPSCGHWISFCTIQVTSTQ